MNLSVIYSKTGKGARALAAKSKLISTHAVRILSYIDGKTSAETIFTQIGKLPESKFAEALSQLLDEGYIKEVESDYLKQSLSEFDIHTPIMVAEISAEEFMQIESGVDGSDHDAKAREQADAEARAVLYAEAQRKLQEEALKQEAAERRLLKVTDILAQSSDSLDIERLASHEPRRPKIDPEARAKHKARKRAAAEQARRDAQQAEALDNAEKSRIAAEQQAISEQAQLEQAEQDKLEQEAMRAVEFKAQAALEAQTKHETEKVALELQLVAAAEARREEKSRLQRDAENNARLETNRLADEAKLQAQALAEAQAQQQAEARALQAAEKLARIEAEKRAKAERKAQQAAQAQAKREAKLKLKAEQLEQLKTEAELHMQAKTHAKHAAEERLRMAAQRKALEKAQRIEREQAEKTLKADVKYKAKQQAAAQAAAKAQEKAQLRRARPAKNYFYWINQTSSVAKKTLLISCVVMLLALVLLPFVNLGFLIGSVQTRIAQNIGEPITIKTLHIALWPQPHLVLDDVSMGSTADIKAESVTLYPVVSTLLDETQTFHSIEVKALNLNESNAFRPMAWLQNASKSRHLKLDRIALSKVAVTWQGFALPIFAADIEINSQGVMQAASLKTEDGHLMIEATPGNNAWMVDIMANAWRFPLGAPVIFDELKANGLLTDHQLQLKDISGRLYDGTFNGLMTIRRGDYWSGNGKFSLAQVDLAEAIPVFTSSIGMEGRLAANAAFFLHSDMLSKLFDAPNINAHFDSTHGSIKGIDLGRALQVGDKQKVISGATAFDQFSGNLILENKSFQLRNLVLKANQLQAEGEADIFANQDLTGKIDIKLATKSRQLQSRIFLSGKLAQPSIK